MTEVPAGNYELTISNCDFMGCQYVLPKTVRIDAGRTTNLDIDIDTGIR